MIYFFPHCDTKTYHWGVVLRSEHGVGVHELKSHPFFHWFEVLRLSVKKRSRPVFVFRYLGDYPDSFRSALRLLSDLLCIVVCFVLGGHVRWIVHNVDRETYMYHPGMLSFRRRIIGWASKKVYVTDQFLLPLAFSTLQSGGGKLGVVTFGVEETIASPGFSERIAEALKDFIWVRQQKPLIGLCASAVADKCHHFFMIESLLDALNAESLQVVMVVVCNTRGVKSRQFRQLFSRLGEREDVILFPDGGAVYENHLKGKIDFIYRSLSDQSVPYTLYNAAASRIPVLTHDVGLTATIVRNCGIGVVWEDLDTKSRLDLESALGDCEEHRFEEFLTERTWQKGAAALVEGLKHE